MGKAKQTWMRDTYSQNFDDWLESQYGCEQSELRDEDLKAYEVEYQNLYENRAEYDDEIYWQEQLDWYHFNNTPISIFNSQTTSVKELIKGKFQEDTMFSILVMSYAHVVASLESYLASTFINNVTNDPELIKKLVESDPEFGKRKFTLKEMYIQHSSINRTVTSYLQTLIFHRIEKVKPMFIDVFEFEFGDVEWLIKAVSIRHDCVHRAGLSKKGQKISLTTEDVIQLIEKSSSLVQKIERHIQMRENEKWRIPGA